MEWVIAGGALLIIAVFVIGSMRSAGAPRSSARRDRHGDGSGAAIATGVIIAGAAATAADDEPVDGGGGGGGDAGG